MYDGIYPFYKFLKEVRDSICLSFKVDSHYNLFYGNQIFSKIMYYFITCKGVFINMILILIQINTLLITSI